MTDLANVNADDFLLAADAVRDYRAVKDWRPPADGALVDLTMNWRYRCGEPGHELLREEVRDIVAKTLPGLVAMAVERIKARADEAVTKVLGAAPARGPAVADRCERCHAPHGDMHCYGCPEVCEVIADDAPSCRGCTCWKAVRASCS